MKPIDTTHINELVAAQSKIRELENEIRQMDSFVKYAKSEVACAKVQSNTYRVLLSNQAVAISHLEDQLRREREAHKATKNTLDDQVAQLQTTISQQDGLLNQISEISDQPFTETHEHLPAWIKTILKTRIDYAKREWDAAKREMDAALATCPAPAKEGE